MVITLRHTLIQAVRSWVKASLEVGDEQVIPVVRGSNTKLMRLPLPYLTVNLTSFDIENGVDWEGWTADGTYHRGNRTATVRIMGFGEETNDWLTILGMLTGDYPKDYGSLINLGNGVMDVSTEVSDHIEPQYVRDFRLDYRLGLTLTDTDNPTTYADTFVVHIEEDDEPLTTIEV